MTYPRKPTGAGCTVSQWRSTKPWAGSRRSSRRRASGSLSAVHGAVRALQERDVELADEVIAFDDEIDRCSSASRSRSSPSRPPDAGRPRPAPAAGDHPHQPPARAAPPTAPSRSRSSSKLVSDVEPDPAPRRGARRDGRARRGDAPRRARLVRPPRPRERGEPRRPGRAHRPARTGASSSGSSTSWPTRTCAKWGLRMVVVARTIERIGDRAVDIGEQTATCSRPSSASSPTRRIPRRSRSPGSVRRTRQNPSCDHRRLLALLAVVLGVALIAIAASTGRSRRSRCRPSSPATRPGRPTTT